MDLSCHFGIGEHCGVACLVAAGEGDGGYAILRQFLGIFCNLFGESLSLQFRDIALRMLFCPLQHDAVVRDGMKTPTEDDTTSQIRAETNSQRQPRE